MNELHLPWLEALVLMPLVGALWVTRLRNPSLARAWSVLFSGITFLLSVGAWQDFDFLDVVEADDRWHMLMSLSGHEVFVIDQLSAPLLPLVALLFFLTTWATLPNQSQRFSFGWTLLSEAIVLATFSCKEPWGIIALLALGTLPPYLELRERGNPIRVYVVHMAMFVAMMVIGWTCVAIEGDQGIHSLWVTVPLVIAIFIRSGIVPFQCWMPDLFENVAFGTALLFVTPIVGAYLAIRLVLPIAPDWVLGVIGLQSLVTAAYAAGMALIQQEARRLSCYLFLSHSSLVLVGLEILTPIGLTGALCVWLSVALAMGGFGLTLRALEARRGRLSLARFQGLYEHTPNLAMCFILTGLASVGFPGTFGFIGTELLVDGVVEAYPYIGIAVVLAAALNGIAIVRAYFLLFTGTRYVSSISLKIRARERYAVLALAALILIGGLIPQPGVASRYRAAEELLRERAALPEHAAKRSDPVPLGFDATARLPVEL